MSELEVVRPGILASEGVEGETETRGADAWTETRGADAWTEADVGESGFREGGRSPVSLRLDRSDPTWPFLSSSILRGSKH